MRSKRFLAAAVSLVMAAGQFSVGAFADNADENSNAAFSADDETTMEQDVILLNAEPKYYGAGDVSGDGKIDISDIIKTAAHIKGANLLSGKAFAAADINGDNVINISDLTAIAAHVKGKKTIKEPDLPVVKNPREKQTDVTLIEFNVDKDTKTVSWNAAADMTNYNVRFTSGDKTKTVNTRSTSTNIPYDMFKDGKLTVTITPSRMVKTEDGTRTYDYGDTTGYLLKIKPEKISGSITVTDDNGKAKIDWKAADFATGYHVYDITNTASDGKPKLIADTDTDQLITDFPASGTVKLLIVPFNSVGEAEGANAEMTKGSSGNTDPVVDLAAPTFSSYFYNSDTNSATLMWNAVSGAEGYEASIQIDGKWVAYDAKTARNYKFTNLASCTGFKTRVRAYKTVNGQKAYGKYSTVVTVVTDGYVKCTTATPIYASASTGSTKLGNLSVGDTIMQTDLPANGWTKVFLPNSNGTKVGYVPTSCLGGDSNTDPVADLAAPTFNSYFYNSDTTTATLMWNAVSSAEGYEASIQIDGKWVSYDAKTARNYKFTNLASCTGFKTRVRAYKTVNGQKAYGKYSSVVTVVTDGYVKCTTATPIYASASTGSTKLGNLSVGDTIMQTDLPANGWTKVFLPNSNGTKIGYVPTSCLGSNSNTDPVADLAAPTFNSYFYNSDTNSATLMWNAVSGAEGYEASIQINGSWVSYNTTAKNYKFTNLASCTGFKTRVRAYKTVNGQKAYGKYSTVVTVVTDGYVKCTTATPIYASASTGSTKLGNLSVGDTIMQTDLPANGWTKVFLPNSNGTKVGYVPTSCLGSNSSTDPVADLAAPTFNSYFYNSDTTTATLMWNAVSGAEGYEASIQIDGKWVSYDAKTARNYKFTNLTSCTGFKTRVRAYKTVNGQKAYGKYSTVVTVVTDGYVKCTTATPIYASASTGSTKLGNLSVGDTIMQTDLPANGWTKVFLPNSNGTKVGYVPTSCLGSNSNTDPVADLAAPTFNSYFYNSDTNSATLMWNAVSGAEGYEASIQINGSWVSYDAKTARNYKFTNLASCTGFKTRVRAYKTVNGQKAYGKYSTVVTVVTDGYVKCTKATPIYASESTGSTKLGNLSVGDTIMQTDLPANGWTKVFLPNSNGTKIGYVPTNCLGSNSNTDPVADLAAPTFSSYFYNSDTNSATLMWNAVSGAEGYEASIQINGSWVSYDAKTARNYKFTNLASCTGFKTRVRAYKTVNGQKAYGKYSTVVTVVTDGYVKCTTATPIYASASTGSTKLGNLSVGDTIMQTDLPANGWTKVFLPNSNGTKVGYVPTSCLGSNSNTDPVADLAAPTFNSYFYNSDTNSATLMWNAVSGAEGYEASIQIDGKWVSYDAKTARNYKFTNLASCTGFKTRVRAYKTVNGQKAYGKYSSVVTVVTDGYVKCTTATPIYASASTGSTKLGNLSVGDTIMQTDLPANGWTKVFLPNSNGTKVGYVPTSCLGSNSNTDPVADLAAPTFNSYFYNSDTNSATLMWNAVSGATGYEASIQINGSWVTYTTTAQNYKFTNLAQRTGFKTRVRAYKTVNGQKAYGKYSTVVTVVTDGYVKCTKATPIYASASTGSTKLGNLSVGDTIMQTDLPANGWTKIFLPNSNGTKIGYIPTSCVKNYANSAMTVISQDGYLGGNPAVLGCEETALASVLNYQFGINVSKNTLIDYYMPEQAFYNGTINVDPNYCFWGSPYRMEGSVGYGCYAPLVAQSAHQYLTNIGERSKYNIALYTDYYTGNNVNGLKFDPSKLDLGNTKVSGGLDLDGLKAEIDKGNNPIVWYSEIEPYAVCTQTLTAGQTYTNPGSGTYNFTWYGRQHTVVLTGYDDANNCFIIGNVENLGSSSYYGVVNTVSYDFFMSSYTTLGRQSIVITKK